MKIKRNNPDEKNLCRLLYLGDKKNDIIDHKNETLLPFIVLKVEDERSF